MRTHYNNYVLCHYSLYLSCLNCYSYDNSIKQQPRSLAVTKSFNGPPTLQTFSWRVEKFTTEVKVKEDTFCYLTISELFSFRIMAIIDFSKLCGDKNKNRTITTKGEVGCMIVYLYTLLENSTYANMFSKVAGTKYIHIETGSDTLFLKTNSHVECTNSFQRRRSHRKLLSS